MDCEKNNQLQDTADFEPILVETFLIGGELSDLYLYPQHFEILQKGKIIEIPFKFGLSFDIITVTNGDIKQHVGLALYFGKDQFILHRGFWPKAKKWEEVLLNYVARKNFHDFFKPIRKIGQGNFANVYLADDLRRKQKSAIKAFAKAVALEKEGSASLQNEIKLLRKLKHPNLISFYGVYQTQNSIYLNMQYIQGTTLSNFIKNNPSISIQQRRKILKGLLLGLKQLSRLKIVHRDLKPDNIIVSENCQVVKIIDFGLATHIDEQKYIFVRCGTPGFVAPEILKIKDNQSVVLGLKSDMYSLGAIYYQLIYDRPLFKGKNLADVIALNKQSRISFRQKNNLGFGQMELLQLMLKSYSQDRISPSEALKSDFFTSENYDFNWIRQQMQAQTPRDCIFELI